MAGNGNFAVEAGAQEEEKVKHRFSEPWEDSDVILVVEDEKFHAHRLILSMNSPVFKAMFKSQFKEATANEIPLPGKKANEVLDFLKQFYLEERQEITMKNVEHLLKLSDEYQVKVIFDRSIKFVANQRKTNENVMKILKLANLYELDYLRESCYSTIKEMKLQSILKASQDQDIDKETVETMLSRRIQRLENFLERFYPSFIEIVDRSFRLWYKAGNDMKWCPEHFKEGRVIDQSQLFENTKNCNVCKQMLAKLGDYVYLWGYHDQWNIQEFSRLVRILKQ